MFCFNGDLMVIYGDLWCFCMSLGFYVYLLRFYGPRHGKAIFPHS